MLMLALPSTLVRLELDIGFIGFQTSTEFVTGLGRLKMMQCLVLVASWCQDLVNADQLWIELEQLHALEELHLDFSCLQGAD